MSRFSFLCACVTLLAVVALSLKPTEDQSVTVFLCADDGTYSGMSELNYLSHIVFQQVPMNISYCQSVNMGYARTLSGNMIRVMIATTGIGSVNAAACTTSILLSTGFEFRRMVFVGTSGVSPVIGGFNPLDSTGEGCTAQGSDEALGMSLGSVCVTSVATDMECGTCVSNPASNANALPNECTRPDCTQHTQSNLFGPCDFRTDATLANDIIAANGGVVFPTMPSVVSNGTVAYWSNNDAAPQSLRNSPPFRPRLVTQCAESDAQQIWVGAPLDYICREYASGAMGNGANATSIPCFAAMEGYAFLQVMSKTNIPSAIIRGASNWDMYPMTNVGTTSAPRWVQNTTYMDEEDRVEFIKSGYRYTIRTTNLVVLNYLGSL